MRKGYEAITSFIFMSDELEKADVILIPGGSQPALMERAAKLYHDGYAPYILISGGVNKKLAPGQTEYAYLREIGLSLGVPDQAILKEDQAAHTFDNAVLSKAVLTENKIQVKKAILVCKNYHARRAYLTYKVNFPKAVQFIVQPIVDSRNITAEHWMDDEDHRKRVLGEVEKIGKYFQGVIHKLM